MKTPYTPLIRALSLLIAVSAMSAAGWAANLAHPERFGVIDITPTNLSWESYENSEPSIGVGTGPNYGKLVVHAFAGNYLYTTANAGGPPWTSPGTVNDGDATLDWSTAGTCYIALLPYANTMNVLKSTDPATIPFTKIASATYASGGFGPDQPWVRVVNVAGVDHIYVGFNDLGQRGKTASIRYSLNGGVSWQNTVIEKVTPGAGQDSPAVRLAISADGKSVYALFQRWTASPNGGDFTGDVVLVRDDHYGAAGYSALGGGNGALVAHNVLLPWSPGGGTSLGAQRIGDNCDIAINSADPAKVYVAYTEVVNGAPVVRVQYSADSGATFSLVYTVVNASLPALAVAVDGTVGLLYALINGNNLEVHFAKAPAGSFYPNNPVVRILARWPNNNPILTGLVYIGDYFTLKAVGYNFFGTFCASGDPQPSHFPSGVYYQRNVKVGGTVQNNFTLSSPGALVDLSGQPVAPSIDPFVFYDIASSFNELPYANLIGSQMFDPGDPYSGILHLSWPALPASQPPFQLLTSPLLGSGAHWTPVTNNSIIQTDGKLEATFIGTEPQRFFRLGQALTGAQFNIFASADGNGALDPTGVVTVAAGQSQTFTATPDNNYAVGDWHLDGVVLQSNGPSLTLNNIANEHTVVATFVASNDLAVTIADFQMDDGPTLTFNTNYYLINVENRGLNLLTGISMSNYLDPTVSFVSATTTQGTVSGSGNLVTADLGSLAPGASASVTIYFLTSTEGSITDIVNVACSQFEPNLDNNTATDITAVIDPVIITTQPASQTVPAGETAVFSVGVSGTPPFAYQWFFNSVPIVDETNSTLTLSNLTFAQAGTYSVSVYQLLLPEDTLEADSDPATLAVVSSPGLPVATTLDAYNIHTTAANLDGTVDPNGADTTCYYQFGTDYSYGEASSAQVVTAGSGLVNLAISALSLSPGITYHFQLVASNSFGISLGGDRFFTTTAIQPGAAVATLAATSITTTSAVLNGTINGQGSQSVAHFQYGADTSYAGGQVGTYFTVAGGDTEAFNYTLTGLIPNTTYHFRAFGFNCCAEGFGGDVTFTTTTNVAQPPPAIATLAATSISTTSAVLNATINGQGSQGVAHFQYGTDTSYTGGQVDTFFTAANGDTEFFNYTLTGLTPNTTYHFRAFGFNCCLEGFGEDDSFTTGAPQPRPTATTLAASNIQTNSAQFNATVNPNGAPTTAYFQYGLTASYGSVEPPVNLGSGTTAQSTAATAGLAPNTTYHYRIVAYNSSGTNYGADTTVTTAWIPVPPILISPGSNAPAGPYAASLAPTFNWSASGFASSSDLVIRQSPYGVGNVVYDVDVGAASSITLPGGVLQPGTAYAWFMVSFNSLGDESAASPFFYFHTPSAPSVSTMAATSVSANGAQLNGFVNPNGASSTAWFEYGTTTSYGNVTTQTGIGTAAQNFSAHVILNSGTTYHYRITAANLVGTTHGSDMTFTTSVP